MSPHASENSPKTVLVSHLPALIAGWVAYTVVTHGIAPTSIEPMSESGLRIVGSLLLACGASTAVFSALHVDHPMAYVIACTAAIGAFPTILALTVVMVAILCVACLQVLRLEFGPESDGESTALVGDFP